MLPTRQGSFHLFRFLGIDVFLHWSWFLLALYEIQARGRSYGSVAWNVLEYLTLFLIVLMHEFGHALACRQVGGQANQIVLWPLGGVAYVAPPQRPGAMLWSIAAGPLVNVILFPLLTGLLLLAESAGWANTRQDLFLFVQAIWYINAGLLMFNLFPIYPLDGGQILRSLLWFIFGRANSLMIATGFGFLGVAGLVVLAFWLQSIWVGVLSVFIVLNCWRGLMQARALSKLARLPRREGFACPRCKTAPPVGPFWICGQCRQGFDTFEAQAVCPHCATPFATTVCLDCGEASLFGDWLTSVPAPPKL
jgi:Zn-dependent protease